MPHLENSTATPMAPAEYPATKLLIVPDRGDWELPTPHFYWYGQTDLEAFCRAAAERISGPIFVYNLATPSRRQPLAVRTRA